MKLCFFGDSIGKGIVYDKERGRYVPTENSFVRLVGEEEKIDIENFSRFGCTVTRGEQIVERNVPEIKSSDYVVLEFGGNDSDYNWKKIADDPDAEHSPNTPLSVFVETYKKVIGEIKKLGKIPVILNLPPVDARKYFRWVSNGVNGDNIMKWLGGDEIYIYRWHEMYNAAICDLSNSMKIPMIDIRSAFLVKRRNPSERARTQADKGYTCRRDKGCPSRTHGGGCKRMRKIPGESAFLSPVPKNGLITFFGNFAKSY